MSGKDESAMLAELKAGQYEPAFNKIVELYSRQLYWQIRKMVISHDDANDVLQNTFIKVWHALPDFRGEAKLSTWMYRIAVNETMTFLNAQRARHIADTLDLEDILLQNLEGDAYFSGDEAQKKLQQAILTLPDKQRLVFNLKYFDEMKYEDMSAMLGTSVGALKASYHLAVKKIENYLRQED